MKIKMAINAALFTASLLGLGRAFQAKADLAQTIQIQHSGLMSLSATKNQVVPSLVLTRIRPMPRVAVSQEKYLLSGLGYSDNGRQITQLQFTRINMPSQSGQSSVLTVNRQKNRWISEDRVDRTLAHKKLGFGLTAKDAATMAALFGELQNRLE